MYTVRNRRPRAPPDDGLNRVRLGMFRGSVDIRWLHCFQKRCYERRKVSCPVCLHLPYVPSNLRIETKPKNESYIDHKLGFLMADLRQAQCDTFYNTDSSHSSNTTPYSSPAVSIAPTISSPSSSVILCSTYSPPRIVRAKAHLVKFTNRVKNSIMLLKKGDVSSCFASSSVTPRLRKNNSSTALMRPASSPETEQRMPASRPNTVPVLASAF